MWFGWVYNSPPHLLPHGWAWQYVWPFSWLQWLVPKSALNPSRANQNSSIRLDILPLRELACLYLGYSRISRGLCNQELWVVAEMQESAWEFSQYGGLRERETGKRERDGQCLLTPVSICAWEDLHLDFLVMVVSKFQFCASLFEPGFCHIQFNLNLDFYQVCPALFIQVNGGGSIFSWDRKGICDYNQRLTPLLGKGSSDVDTRVHHHLLLPSTLP